MTTTSLPTSPYVPQTLVVKVTNVPDSLKEHPALVKIFKQIIEEHVEHIDDTSMSKTLSSYSMPSAEQSGVDFNFYSIPDREIKTLNAWVRELKDKFITRNLREICNICFKEKQVVVQEKVGVGFDLLIYELSEDGSKVIDAWSLVNFTIPYGLDVPRVYSQNNIRSGISKAQAGDELRSMPLEGTIISNDSVIQEAQLQHKFTTESKAG